ncbi:unnamed protein product [Dibothriocephalus latus]|uniref:Uncharacterized protein n=1 Tax=Dibothriocephalus latus TaxID=60516 RepID=A0A3P6T1S1_DIBLA|nr:unnamed protein product [Dibothriocephalus latus]
MAELHCLLTKESARTSSLLAEISLMRKRLEPDDVRRKCEQLQDEAALRCCDYQREISAELPSASLQTLLEAKERLRELYAAQIETAVESLREKQRGLNYQVPFLTGDYPPKTYQNHDHSTRLKVLKFGLEERLRHLADAKSKSKVLEDQLETIKTQQNVSKIETIRRLFALFKTRREHIDVLRQEIRQNLQTMQTITPAVRQDSKEHIFQMAQTMTRLKNQIREAKSEVAQLKQNPVLRLQQLKSSIFALKTAITNSEARQLASKVDIRSGVKQFKKLSCDNERLKKVSGLSK